MTQTATKPLMSQIIFWFQAQADRLRARQPTRPKTRASAKRGFVSLVGAGPGSADLITLRGMQRLQAADVVFYDRLADPALLAQMRRGARAVYVGKAPGQHAVPQAEINALLVQAARAGHQVVRLKCGDPGIFARGAEEAQALTEAGIEWDIVPGVTSACAAAASARSFLTERGQTEFLVLATGHSRPDASHDWQGMARPGTTLACYMAVAQSAQVSQGLQDAGWPAQSAVEVVSKAQTADEKVFHCRLDGLHALCLAHPGLNPAMLIIRWPLAQTAKVSRPQAMTA